MKIKVTKLDTLWANAVKKRDGYRCRKCGKVYPKGSRGIQAAHIFGRRHKSTRWDMSNGLTLCFGCHRWNHENPVEYAKWLKEEIGQAEIDRLNIKRFETFRKGDEYKFEMYLKSLEE